VIIVHEMYPHPVQPVCLRVPPGHRKGWKKHCGQYRACGVPVYFVQDGWYRDSVRPEGKGKGKDKDKDKDKGHGEKGD